MNGSNSGLPNDFQSGEVQRRGNMVPLELVDIEGVNDLRRQISVRHSFCEKSYGASAGSKNLHRSFPAS